MKCRFFLEKKSFLPIFYYNMIDLHSHTFFSDGTLSPQELIDKAIKRNISHLAITDHDTCLGLDPAMEYSSNRSINIIGGIEIEVDFSPGDFHLLGLGLKNWKGNLQQSMNQVLEKREERNHRVIELMQKDGVSICYGDVRQEAESTIIARPHFARVLIKKGLARDIKDAFDRFLGPGKVYYSPKEALTLEEALSLVKEAGGKAILAHPLSLYISWGRITEYLKRWKEMGLDGIEAWHSGARVIEAERFTALAKELGMLVTGGSDYHGKNQHGRELGYGPGKQPLKEELLDGLL